MCRAVYHMCMDARGQKRMLQLELGWEPSNYGCWKLNLGHLKEQVLSTSEPSSLTYYTFHVTDIISNIKLLSVYYHFS